MTTNPATLYAAVPYVYDGISVRAPAPDPYLLPRPGWPQAVDEDLSTADTEPSGPPDDEPAPETQRSSQPIEAIETEPNAGGEP